MNIKEKFLELTSRTYPHGTEECVYPLLTEGLKEDEFGNLFIKVGESSVMFTSHLDTATSKLTTVNHVIEGKMIKTDGKSILGADDKAGVTIMMYMIEKNVPGLYYFFLGEEVGCVGSKKLANKLKTEKIEGIDKVISFDRRGTDSVITYQGSKRCASDEFGTALSDELNKADSTFKYENDPTGVCTDSIQFVSIYPECTNISVGYYNEHTFSESQDIEHLEKLAKACVLVNWESLPVERDPSKVEYKSYGGYGSGLGYGAYYGDDDDWDNDSGTRWSGWSRPSSFDKEVKNKKVYVYDKTYNHVSLIEFKGESTKVARVELSKERVELEHRIIDDLLRTLDLSYEYSKWDGFTLDVNYGTNDASSADRNDLLEYLPELDYSTMEEIGDLNEIYSQFVD